MSKKEYDLSKIENELKGASSFFKNPTADNAAPTTEAKASDTEATISGSTGSRETLPSPADGQSKDAPATTQSSENSSRPPVRPVRPVRRQMIRHPFELYQDQVEGLRQLATEDRMRGGAGSMSAMVREAIDRLIKEQSESPD